MGGLLVAVSTPLPELVTTIAAVRRGAVDLAVHLGGAGEEDREPPRPDAGPVRAALARAAGAGATPA